MSIPSDPLLLRAKDDIWHRLLGDEALANVPVIRGDEHDADSRDVIDLGPRNVRNGRTGACVMVSAIGVTGVDAGGTPTPLMTIGVEIECVEDVLVNAGPDGTGMDAAELVARVVQSLHLSHYDEKFTGLRLADRSPVSELLAAKQGERGFAVRFEASGVAFGLVATCAPVLAAFAAGKCTLSCATSGVSIFYTTDGSYPGNGNPEADLYDAPFDVSPGESIRAAAEKEGMNASKIILFHAAPAA